MRLALLPSVSNPNVYRTAYDARSIENARCSCALDGEQASKDRFLPVDRDQMVRSAACQNDTAPAPSHWDGPRLRPAFVAQVIGQVLMNTQSRALVWAPSAYRQRNPPKIALGRLLDTGI
jgi:hypothetical protein